jgi:23S rRNA (cytosine1962-C5)-methyltransferase
VKGYALLDSGFHRKLERFEDIVLDRPCSQAIWKPLLPKNTWQQAHARFDRLTEKDGEWKVFKKMPESWHMQLDDKKIKLCTTSFGHLGVFPEQRAQWEWLGERVKNANEVKPIKVLNLFAYSGGSTLACIKPGVSVVHLDASRPMITWAKENAELNNCNNGITWMLEDVTKYLKRELRRGNKYDGIILDPPSFGRGPKKELFKIEQDFRDLIEMCVSLLKDEANFMLLSCHTPGITAMVLENMLSVSLMKKGGKIISGEMLLEGASGVLPLPSGCYARWMNEKISSYN